MDQEQTISGWWVEEPSFLKAPPTSLQELIWPVQATEINATLSSQSEFFTQHREAIDCSLARCIEMRTVAINDLEALRNTDGFFGLSEALLAQQREGSKREIEIATAAISLCEAALSEG